MSGDAGGASECTDGLLTSPTLGKLHVRTWAALALGVGEPAVALGRIADKEPLPWNARISTNIDSR